MENETNNEMENKEMDKEMDKGMDKESQEKKEKKEKKREYSRKYARLRYRNDADYRDEMRRRTLEYYYKHRARILAYHNGTYFCTWERDEEENNEEQ